MKGKTVFCIFICFSLMVSLGVYLSESATNELLGTAASPKFMTLTPEESGTWLVQFLGQAWLVDPAAIKSRSLEYITKAHHTLKGYWVQVVER